MLFWPRDLKSLNSIEKTQLRILCGTFNGNSNKTIIYANDETDNSAFNDLLSSFVQHILKHKILLFEGNKNTQISKDKNNKLGLQKLTNRNGLFLTDFSPEKSFTPKH